MKITDFDVYKDLLRNEAGLELAQDHNHRLESRLRPIAKKWGYSNVTDMTIALNGVPQPELIREIVESMIDGTTAFFRDPTTLLTLKNVVLPRIKAASPKQRKVWIWCVGCSSGQEPYSLAMMLNEYRDELPKFKYEIVASDISRKSLSRARQARYSAFEVQHGLSTAHLLKYFKQDGDDWKLKNNIRNRIKFKHFNIMDPFASLGRFDVILCLNVLNKFETYCQSNALMALSQAIMPGRYLLTDQNISPEAAAPGFTPVDGHRGLFTG